jgi:hypothetical protein
VEGLVVDSEMSKQWLDEPARQTPILYDADVVVVGGGTAGCIAAIAAARSGAETVLVERFGTLGGCPTVGRCAHIGNRFIDEQLRWVIGGIPLELMQRVAREGGTRSPDFEDSVLGKTIPPVHILIDPEILSIVLLEMVEEAGVKLMLHSYYCDPVMKGNVVRGIVVQNKSGRNAVLADSIVDCSGEADVAVSAGAPCHANPKTPPIASTWALLMRMGNVDHQAFMGYVLNLPAGEPRPDMEEWLTKQVDMPIQELKKNWYWSFFLDPQPVDEGVPRNHPGKTGFSQHALDWYREKWTTEKDFSYVEMHFFRDKIREAVDNGDFDLVRLIDSIGRIGFNYDGVTGSEWRKGEVIINGITLTGFDAFNSEHISKIEINARRRVLEISRFMQKYIPGFEQAYIVDTGAQTLPRHIRRIEAKYALTLKDLEQTDGFKDAVYVATYNDIPGIAHQVPLSMMIPKQIENVIVAGKCADGAHLVRDIPSVMTMGQAAGVAAAMAARTGISPGKLDIDGLQHELREQGVIVDLPDH